MASFRRRRLVASATTPTVDYLALLNNDLPVDRLGSWLAERVPVEGDLRAQQLSGGSSNLTFLLHDDCHRWVLRRPPGGPRPATAHDVGREFAVQHALAGTGVPVATMVAHCPDDEVIGAPFYVMNHVEGVVYHDATDVSHLDRDQARGAAFELVDVLARLHAVDPASVGLAGLGRPGRFAARQVQRWCRQWEAAGGRPVPALAEVAARLEAGVPAEAPATGTVAGAIVHGDFGFNNAMFDRRQPARMVALLDWEMSTLGDPLTDLGMLLAYWGAAGEILWRDRPPLPQHGHEGFPAAAELCDRYATRSGRDLDGTDFYVALAIFKLAVITEAAGARLARDNPGRAGQVAALVDDLAGAAMEVTL